MCQPLGERGYECEQSRDPAWNLLPSVGGEGHGHLARTCRGPMLAHSRIRVEELEKLVFEPLGNLTGCFRPLRAFRNSSDALPAPSQPRTPLGSLESAGQRERRGDGGSLRPSLCVVSSPKSPSITPEGSPPAGVFPGPLRRQACSRGKRGVFLSEGPSPSVNGGAYLSRSGREAKRPPGAPVAFLLFSRIRAGDVLL